MRSLELQCRLLDAVSFLSSFFFVTLSLLSVAFEDFRGTEQWPTDPKCHDT